MTTRLAAMILTFAAAASPALANADQAPPATPAQPKCVAQSQIEEGKVKDSKVICYDTAGNVVSQDDVRVAIFDKGDDKAKLLMAQYYECDPTFSDCDEDYVYEDGPGYYYGGGLGYGYGGGGRGFRGGRGFEGGRGFGGGHGGGGFGGHGGGFGGGGHGGGGHGGGHGGGGH